MDKVRPVSNQVPVGFGCFVFLLIIQLCAGKNQTEKLIGNWGHNVQRPILFWSVRRGTKMYPHQIRAFLWVRDSPVTAVLTLLGGERKMKVEKGVRSWKKE